MSKIYVHEPAQYDAMTDADFEFIETTIDALRKRYPAVQIEVDPWWPDKTKEERDLRRMKRYLISLGNKATYTQWYETARNVTGMSPKTFDRRLKDLKEHGYVTADYEGQGACYSWVKDPPKGVQPEGVEGTTGGGATRAATHGKPGVRDYGRDGSFGDRTDTARHRQSESGGGSPEGSTPSIAELQGLVVDEPAS
jgi:DNA-binding transcriptional ArsR family regulator